MKVGITTFHTVFNYGAMLQAYATQFALRKFGFEPFFVDYYPKSAEKKNKNLELSVDPKSMARFIYSRLNRNVRIRYARFDEFRNSMQRSKRYQTKLEVMSNPPDCNIMMVGSDQVWNCEQGFDSFLFLDWVHSSVPRFSYASSFGTSTVQQDVKRSICSSLEKFVMVAVREQDGLQIIKEATGQHVTRVLDPTFLLDQDEWISISRKYPLKDCFKNGYILCHGFGASPDVLEFIHKLEDQYKLPVLVLKQL